MSVSQQTFEYVSSVVRHRSAIQLPPGKEYLVESRLRPLAREVGLNGPGAIDAYVQRIQGNPAAQTRMVEALTTNETSWFRDQVPFVALREAILPDLLARGPADLRIWSAACSSGQEPYSIVMTLLDAGMSQMSVLGTDLSSAVLDRARAGVYSQLEVNRGMPASTLVRYFHQSGTGWQVAEQVRRHVTFRQHNLLSTPPPGPFDVVFLRNVLIYFDAPSKATVLASVARVLRPGGYLLLGAAETAGPNPQWQPVPNARGAVYQFRGEGR